MGYTDTSIGFAGNASGSAETIKYEAQNSTNPWQKLSRLVYPKTVQAMHAWAAELWLHNGTYSEAISRAVRYFLTDVEIKAIDEESELTYKDKDSYRETLLADFDLKKIGEQAASEYIAFGISMMSVYFPFDRNLICEKCGFHSALDALREEGVTTKKGKSATVSYSNTEGFHGVCPSCDKPTTYEVKDSIRKSDDQKPNIIRWPLKHTALKRNPISGRTFLRVKVSEWRYLAEPVRSGDMDIISELPLDMLEAMQTGEYMEVQQDEFYIMRFPAHTDVDIELNGFGVPAFMSDFELAFMLVVMFKFMETMCIDMVNPWRVLAPKLAGRSASNVDPLLNINMGEFMDQVRAMIEKHRKNPTLISTMAYPIEETQVGGDVQQLIPIEVYEYFTKLLLDNMGIPHEFAQNSLAGNAAPMIGYSLFERDWQHLTNELNGLFTWIGRKLGEQRGWKGYKVELVPSSTHNDPETRQMKLQLAASGQLSWATALKAYGLNYKEERMKVIEEAQWETEMQELIQKLVEDKDLNKQFLRIPSAAENFMVAEQQAAEGGAMPPGGMPAGGGMMPPAPGGGAMNAGTNTVDSHMAQAEQNAAMLMGMTPTDRRRMLAELKSGDFSLYATTKTLLDQYEQDAGQQGVQMAREEAAMANQQMP